jgi:hypothetical protein
MPSKSDADRKIEQVQDLLDFMQIQKLLDVRDYHLRWWFRGQSDVAWDLQPGVYRDAFPARNEADRLKLERQLSQDFRAESPGTLAGNETEAELYFLQQHYRMPTRLLDWTTNPLPGLFFAISGNEDRDGMLFMMDAYVCKTGNYRIAASGEVREFRGVAGSRHPAFEEALYRISRWDDKREFPKFIIPVRPDYRDRRIVAQRSRFTFHVAEMPTLTKGENGSLKLLLIPSASKKRLRDQLFLLGIDDHSIYGDLESLARRLRHAHSIADPPPRPK